MEWITCTLNQLGEIVGGATPSTKNIDNYKNGNISWITPKDLSNYDERFIANGERNITNLGYASCSTKLLPKNSILFSSRAPIGYVAIAKNKLCTNQGFKSIMPNKNTDFLFLYYLLKYNTNAIINMGSGTTFKEISGKTMKSIVIRVPKDIQDQKKIASILSALDDKIELNNKINKNLEEMAQAIFKSWFVDFEPWGGKMPEDWEYGTLSDIANITMGQSPKGSSYNDIGIGTLFFQGKTDFSVRFPTPRLYTTDPKRFAEPNDILMSVRAPVGTINIAKKKCCIGRGLCSIKSKKNHQSFLLYTMFKLQRKLEIFNNEGTVFGAINKKGVNSLPIIKPSSDIIEQYENIISPIDKIIKVNFEETCRLTAIRDTVLPKLMSGELDVSNLDI